MAQTIWQPVVYAKGIMKSRSTYNLKIDTIYTCDIPLDRSFLKLWNGIRHVMPSTDRRLELKEKTSMAQTVWQPVVYAKGLMKVVPTWKKFEKHCHRVHNHGMYQDFVLSLAWWWLVAETCCQVFNFAGLIHVVSLTVIICYIITTHNGVAPIKKEFISLFSLCSASELVS